MRESGWLYISLRDPFRMICTDGGGVAPATPILLSLARPNKTCSDTYLVSMFLRGVYGEAHVRGETPSPPLVVRDRQLARGRAERSNVRPYLTVSV